MRLEWLEDVLAVVETGSFTEAARRRNLTQSAFSRRVRAIETALGIELFDRGRKPVQLHPGVAEQKERIAALVAALRQLTADLRQGDPGQGNSVVIASQHALTATRAPALVSRLSAGPRPLHVRLRSGNLDECFAMLLSRQADILLAYRLPGEAHPHPDDYIETRVIGQDRLVPVVAMAQVQATLAALARDELAYVAYPAEVFFGRVMTLRVLGSLAGRIRLTARAETALTLAAVEMAAFGTAVAWVPASLARPGVGEGRLADLSAHLPDCALELTAVRLTQGSGPAAERAWGVIGGAAD